MLTVLALVAGCDSGELAIDAAIEDVAIESSIDMAGPVPDVAVADTVGDLVVADAGVGDLTADAFPPPVPDNCVTQTGTGTHSLSCSGLTFSLTVPAVCQAQACGVIVDVHGLSMSAEMQNNNTNMRALGNQHGYLVIQPSANPAPPLASWSPADDSKVLDFLQRVIAAFHADTKRIHMTGFSQGGAMTWRFLCNSGDLFASMAPAAYCGGADPLISCIPSGPQFNPPILYLHGMDDPLQGFGCGEQQVSDLVSFWQLTTQTVVAQDADYTWTRYQDGQGGWLEFIAHDYAADSILINGHCYPGSTDQAPSEPGQLFGFGCLPPNAFNWGEAVIAFFQAHPKN